MFIALGSAIGTGLFYGSASAIQLAGPSVLLASVIGGAGPLIHERRNFHPIIVQVLCEGENIIEEPTIARARLQDAVIFLNA